MNETLSALSDWLALHPEWITLALGLAAFIESLAMIGVIVPGVAILYAGAALAGGLGIPLWACLGGAALGAIGGDLLSFYLGRYAHRPALRCWPFKQHPDWLARGERFIQRHGVPSVIIGRFVGPIRPVLPFVAGMLAMPPSRFVPVNILSALLWAPVYILPGYLFGRLAGAGLAAPESRPWLNLLLLLVIVTALLLLWLLRRWAAPDSPYFPRLTQHPRWQRLRSPGNGELPLTSLATLALCGTTFALVTLTVALGNPLTPLDQAIATLFRDARSPAIDPLLVLITCFGDSANLLPLSAIAVATLWWKGDRAGALHWLGAVVLLWGLNWLFKEGLAVPRPQYLIDPFSTFSYSYPSAHSSNSALFFALCASFIAQQLGYRHRVWVYLLCALPITAIGLSRLYLGVHWLSDVIGGISLALTVAAATRLSYSRFQQRLPFGARDAFPLAAAALWTTLYLSWRFDAALFGYQPIPL